MRIIWTLRKLLTPLFVVMSRQTSGVDALMTRERGLSHNIKGILRKTDA